MTAAMKPTPSPVVAVGAARFGNDLPLALIAGPCALESRAHALETAEALKEIAGTAGIGLVYKSSFDKANRTSARSARGIGLAEALPIFAEIRERTGLPVLTDVHEPEQCAAVADRRRCSADPGLPLPPDRSPHRRGADRQGGQREEGPVPRALGHDACRCQGGRRRQPASARHRARRVLRLQHARLGHARAADPRRDRSAGDLRRHPFRAAAWRAGGAERRRAALRAGAGPRRRRGRRRRRVHRDASGPRPRALRRTKHAAAERPAARSLPS